MPAARVARPAPVALKPPGPDEALRPAKDLAECHPFNQVTIIIVLIVDFVQFNALAFNPALGTWSELQALGDSFDSVFLVFGETAYDDQLWVYCGLAIGWVLFALLVVLILNRQRAAQLPTGADAASPTGARGPPVWRVIMFIAGCGRQGLALLGQRIGRWRSTAEKAAWVAKSLKPAPLS